MSDKRWSQIANWATEQMFGADSGHGIDHVRRVVTNAHAICLRESADLEVVIPAAWLHDCVHVAKNSPQRSQASRLAAEKAAEYLTSLGYAADQVAAIYHCIHAHSFSAGIACQTVEAAVVQDADRLEAVGAIGVARCLMTGGSMKQRLYHPDDPFPTDRVPEDSVQSIDHFFAKLLRLAETMQTATGRELAGQRTEFMIQFLLQLASELDFERAEVVAAIEAAQRR